MAHLYEIYLNDENQRMGVFQDDVNGEVHKAYNGKIVNYKNMDLGDLVSFESRYYGWVEGQIVRITSVPYIGDEYDVEFDNDGQKEIETVEGRYML